MYNQNLRIIRSDQRGYQNNLDPNSVIGFRSEG